MSGPIAKYFASLGFLVKKSEIKKVDDFLSNLENGLKRIGKEAKLSEKANKQSKKSSQEALGVLQQKQKFLENLVGIQEKGIKFTKLESLANKDLLRNTNALAKTSAKRVKSKQDEVKATAGLAKANDAVTRSIQKQAEQARKSSKAMQATLDKILPSMAGPLKGQARKDREMQLKSAFMGLPTNAELSKVSKVLGKLKEVQKKSVAGEVSALGRIGQNVRGRAEAKRMAVVGPEVSALGRIGSNVRGNVFRSAQIAEQARNARMAAANKAFAAQEKQRLSSISKSGKELQSDTVWRDKLERQKTSSGDSVLEARARDINQRIRNEEKLSSVKEKEHKREEQRQRDQDRWFKREQQRQRDKMEVLAARSRMVSETNATRLKVARIRASSNSYGDLLHAGGAFGAFARYGIASIPFVGGAYGLSQLNKANQEVVSARLTTKAVTEAAGLQGQGEQAFDWLRQQGHRIGFNYLDQAQDYNNYLSNSLGAGMDLKSAQNTYLGFAEYSKAMGTTPARQKLVMNALSQMMGKGVVSMEELKKQMAESMPGTMDVFATAYQKLLKAKGQGGDKTGQAALEQLYEDVPKRKLVTAELAPYLSEELRRRAAPKLDIAMQTSQSWQGRFGSTMADLAQVASTNGVENGFKNIFRALTKGAEESDGMVAKLAQGFEKASDSAAKLLLWPASFSRALEGKDSQVADWLGIEKTKQLREDWAELSNTIKEVFSLAEPSWLPSLRSITESLQSVLNVAGGVSRTGRETKSVMGQIYDDAISDYGKYSLMGRVVGAAGALRYGLNTTSDFIATKASSGANLLLHHPILNNPVTEFFASPVLDYARNKTEQWSVPTDRYAQYWLWRESQRGIDTSLQYGNDPAAWRDMNSVSNKQVAEEVFGKNGTGINQPITRTEQNTNTFYMEFKFEKGDPAVMEDWFRNSFQGEINKAMPNFSYKE